MIFYCIGCYDVYMLSTLYNFVIIVWCRDPGLRYSRFCFLYWKPFFIYICTCILFCKIIKISTGTKCYILFVIARCINILWEKGPGKWYTNWNSFPQNGDFSLFTIFFEIIQTGWLLTLKIWYSRRVKDILYFKSKQWSWNIMFPSSNRNYIWHLIYNAYGHVLY